MSDHHPLTTLNRRAFLQRGTLLLTAAGTALADVSGLLADETKPALRIGLVTDLHYADKPPRGTRYYRETLGKLNEAAEKFTATKPDFLVELGDLIDAAETVELEQQYLKTINREFAPIAKDRHYVLGNHCVDTLTKDEFLGEVEKKKSYYSFDRDQFHFVVLDACFRSDGTPYQRKNFKWYDANIPEAELEWLAADLKETTKPTIVFAHQRLDVTSAHGVQNSPAVRKILEASGHVTAVFQGHSHSNDHKQIAGIHYCTLVAMVEGTGKENSGFSVLDLSADGTIRLDGFRKQADYEWAKSS